MLALHSLADSAPGVGERVAAIGFPLGAGLTLTQGSVSVVTAITPTGADSATVAMSFVSTQDTADAPSDLPVPRICWQTQLPVTNLGDDARIGTARSGATTKNSC